MTAPVDLRALAAERGMLSKRLIELRQNFRKRDFDIRFVGGCVRDLLCGEVPKDVDLCTDATPEEQIDIYKAAGIDYYETGLRHGTLTVSLGRKAAKERETYEITSLRTESNHDGRHAEVAYTRDWLEDLGRRDLTINAMMLTFDGELVDPFNGQADLARGRVVFVGKPVDRMREDYLRILRWLRFHGRFGQKNNLDSTTCTVAWALASGLEGISKERVWSEVAKIIAGPRAPYLLFSMCGLRIADAIRLPKRDAGSVFLAARFTKNPVTLMTAYAGPDVLRLAEDWKWSTAERQLAHFLVSSGAAPLTPARVRYMLAVEGAPREHVRELALMLGNKAVAEIAKCWPIPACPVDGTDILKLGFKPGPAVGKALDLAKLIWANGGYSNDKKALLEQVRERLMAPA